MFIPIAVFAAIGFEHVVADMFGVPCGIILGSPATVGEYIGKTMVAAFLGNVVGGVALGLSLYFIHIYPVSEILHFPSFHFQFSSTHPLILY